MEVYMATERSSKSSKAAQVAAADFVTKVVADPATPPAVYVFSGYPGPSAREGYTRLYYTPDLSVWLEIPSDAIVHTQGVAPERNVLGAVLMWVRQDAQITGGNRWTPDTGTGSAAAT
jgi:hypothetical protein